MPSKPYYPSIIDPRREVTQESLRAGTLPTDIVSAENPVFYGAVLERHDPNQRTRTLKGKVAVYTEMSADPTVGGALQGYENILSLVKWHVQPANRIDSGIPEEEFDTAKAEDYRNFVQTCFEDMTGTSITDNVAAALGKLKYGHQVMVPHFKIRAGYKDSLNERSKYDDGKIGWKSWKSINPESIDRWLVPDGGGYSDLTGLRQLKVSGGYEIIPRNRFLLFRTTSKNDTIEGESILYSAVGTWERLHRLLNIEEVSLSRNLEGIPKLVMPSRYLSKDATDSQAKLRDAMIRMTKSVKFNEQTALVIPSDTDDKGNRIIDVTLMTAGNNTRVDQCRKVAKDCEQLIAESVLANFLKMGGSGGGSYAMSSSLQDMFVLAMKKYLNNISSVINNEAITTLLYLNGMDVKYAPKLVHKGLDTDSVGVFIDALMKSIAAGSVVPTKSIQRSVLDKLNLPTDEADAAWDKVEELQQKLLEQQEAQQNVKFGQGQDVEDNSNLDEIEATGVELSPEKVQKSLYEFAGKFFEYSDGLLKEVGGLDVTENSEITS